MLYISDLRSTKYFTSVSKLADAHHTSRPGVSRIVGVLVYKGLIARTQNPVDRRNLQLSLTEEDAALKRAFTE
jgi:DNA-binding MarR family transcriptional regulator